MSVIIDKKAISGLIADKNEQPFYENETFKDSSGNTFIHIKTSELEKYPKPSLDENFKDYILYEIKKVNEGKLLQDSSFFQTFGFGIFKQNIVKYLKTINLSGILDTLETSSDNSFDVVIQQQEIDDGSFPETPFWLATKLKSDPSFSLFMNAFLIRKAKAFGETSPQQIFIENDSILNNKFYYYDKQLFGLDSLGSFLDISAVTVKIFLVGQTPTISFEKDFIRSRINAVDYPPQIPIVNISSYVNVNNKVLILLQKDIGESIRKANSISLFTEAQKNTFEEIITSKSLQYKSDLIYSSGQNDERYFVLYRTEQKPTSYSSIIKDTNIIKKLDISKLETSLIDSVQPNKKYYYCFRAEDKNGILSDASLVYEVEIIDESGTIYMKQNIFNPSIKNIEVVNSLDFENRIRIAPAETQITIPDVLKRKTSSGYVRVYLSRSETTNFTKQDLSKFLNSSIDISKDGVRGLLSINSKTQIIDFSNIDLLLAGERLFTEINKLSQKSFYLDLFKILIKETAQSSQAFKDTGTISTLPTNFLFSDFFSALKAYDPSYVIEFVIGEYGYRFTDQITLPGGGSFSIKNYIKDVITPIDLTNTIKETYLENIKKHKDLLTFEIKDTLDPNSVFQQDKIFKIRIQSQNSKKKFDLNVNYNIQALDGIKTLQEAGITKKFEVLLTEEI